MRSTVRILLAIALWLVAGLAVASTLVLDGEKSLEQLPMAPHLAIYTGADIPADARAASRLPDGDYQPVGPGSPLGLRQKHWFRFSVKNTSSNPRSLVFDFDQALYSRIEWRTQVGGTQREFVTGQSYPYDTRDIYYNYFAFRLDIPPGETLTADFSIYTPYAALFVPVLSDSDHFVKHQPQLWQFSGAVVGMLYSALLCLLLYVVRMPRPGAAVAMLGQVTFSMLSVLYMTGIVQKYLPDGGAIPWRDIAYVLIHVAQGSCYALAVRSFFQLSERYPVFNRLLLLLLAAGALLVVLLPFVDVEQLVIATLAVNFFTMMVSVVLAVVALVKRQQGVALFAVGLLLFVLLAWVSVMGTAGFLPASLLTRYAYELGLTIQADCLFLAIVLRFFAIEREQVQMQEDMLRLDAEMKARSEFVERVSHDLKSPLSAVIGATQLLRDKQEPAGQKYLDIIQRSTSMVLGIIDDILTHSRMKASGLSLRYQPFDVRDLVDSIESSARASQQAHHVQFSAVVGDDVPPEVFGDRLRLGQLLNNLLSNAFKFTDEGRVSLTVERVSSHPDGVDLRFTVQDTGIGMSTEFLQRAFEPYTREESGKGYRQGFGLGLSICRQLTDLMGGSIDVLSAVGQGTRFTVVIPFASHED